MGNPSAPWQHCFESCLGLNRAFNMLCWGLRGSDTLTHAGERNVTKRPAETASCLESAMLRLTRQPTGHTADCLWPARCISPSYHQSQQSSGKALFSVFDIGARYEGNCSGQHARRSSLGPVTMVRRNLWDRCSAVLPFMHPILANLAAGSMHQLGLVLRVRDD